jgi:aldehyde:ferredoxin oxidoreductase
MISGTGRLPVYDMERAYAAGKDAYRKVFAKTGFKEWTPEGTAGITDWTNAVGVFPTRNFQTSYAEHHKSINGKAILDQLKITDKGCFCCPTPCGKYGHTKTDLGDAFVEGPEYETIALFGGNCLLQGRNMRPSPFSGATACCGPYRKWPTPIMCVMNLALIPYRRAP